jgi:hypothetical protein
MDLPFLAVDGYLPDLKPFDNIFIELTISKSAKVDTFSGWPPLPVVVASEGHCIR